MAEILLLTGALGEARKLCESILGNSVNDPEALNISALIHLQRGEPQTALSLLRQALANSPEPATIHSNLLYALLMNPATTPDEYLNEARQWQRQHKIPDEKIYSHSPADPQPSEKKLRLGFISADLRRHSVSYFLLPLLKQLKNHKFAIYSYADIRYADDYSELIKQNSNCWRPIRGLDDATVAEMIKSDKIDILIELGGHTASNRLPLLTRQPAPVQISWLGYPASTGLSNNTFRLSDTTVDPDGSEKFYSEPLLRMKRPFLCYAPPQEAVNLRPGIKKDLRPITFGSFNNPAKINQTVISIWSQILHRTPHSRLVLKSKVFRDEETRKTFLQRFAKLGITEERVLLHPGNPETRDHFKSYQNIDIALDTFPYNGTTTTFEALWMGVPVITLCGTVHATRVGADLLRAISCPELIANNENEYIDLAVNLAGNRNQQAHYHKNLRQNLQNSSLMDAEDFAENFAEILTECWTNWLKNNNEVQEDRFSRACTLHNQGCFEEAAKLYEKILADRPESVDAAINLSRILILGDKLDKARAILEKTIQLNPKESELYFQLATIMHRMREPGKAHSALLNCLKYNPGDARAWSNLGYLQQNMNRREEAVISFQQALKINPDQSETAASLLWHIVQDCDWKKAAIWNKKLDYFDYLALKKQGPPATEMFFHLAREEREAINYERACAKSTHTSSHITPLTRTHNPTESSRVIKLAYLSGDFRDHPVAHNIVNLFRLHDRNKFQVTAYSCGPDDGSDYRRRIEQGCDRFVDIHNLPDLAAAELIREDKIDILVELMGHTRENRLRLCAFRPAPVQISYLGYPGTTGADFIDYIIADKIVIPPEQQKFYSEKVIYLPDSFMIADQAPIGSRPTRQAQGLPSEAFIFCSFNNAYKIEPVMFDIWMKILHRVPRSILWLRQGSATMEKNLRSEAEKRGIKPERLFFAAKVPDKKDHLARLQLADISLDTRIYNGHTTTLDALWAGVPVITLRGGHFASRVSSSNLNAIGLNDLITDDLECYLNLAVKLAQQPEQLTQIRNRLALNRENMPLFNTETTARKLEKAYQTVWLRYCSQQTAATVDIE